MKTLYLNAFTIILETSGKLCDFVHVNLFSNKLHPTLHPSEGLDFRNSFPSAALHANRKIHSKFQVSRFLGLYVDRSVKFLIFMGAIEKPLVNYTKDCNTIPQPSRKVIIHFIVHLFHFLQRKWYSIVI